MAQQQGFWAEFEKFGRLIEAQEFVFAKTMPENPHYYTLRKTWTSDRDFDWAVKFIRAHGYEHMFWKKKYVQIDLNGQFYWTMGAPVGETILINRKVKTYHTEYDDIARDYDQLFEAPQYHAEDKQVFDIVGPAEGLSVLDIGCGTGLALDHLKPGSYVGIDVSFGMLQIMKRKHPAARTINTSFRSFVGGVYQLVLGTYGVGSEMSLEELERVPTLVAKGGKAVMMFYNKGYNPRTYQETGINVPYHAEAPIDRVFPGAKVSEVNGHVVVEWKK